jgi:hypothetical protein
LNTTEAYPIFFSFHDMLSSHDSQIMFGLLFVVVAVKGEVLTSTSRLGAAPTIAMVGPSFVVTGSSASY